MLDLPRRVTSLLLLGAALAACASEEVKAPRTVQPIADAHIEGLPLAVSIGDAVLAEQPTPALLSDLKHQGFATVINLRPNKEMSFDEGVLVRATGLKYVSIPVTGAAIGDTEIKHFLEEVRGALDRKEKFLVHCASVNRSAALWAIYEITDLKVPPEEAVQRARQAGLKSPELIGVIGQYARGIGAY
ncbi:MAG TPA: sulfur transferase domain-containing protein [Planctomycetota bacterium]|nr:sulfur transferase domain-containing protein [Planctomycetota bacterium]